MRLSIEIIMGSFIFSIATLILVFNIISSYDYNESEDIINSFTSINNSFDGTNTYKLSLDLNTKANYRVLINKSNVVRKINGNDYDDSHLVEVDTCMPGEYLINVEVCSIKNRCESVNTSVISENTNISKCINSNLIFDEPSNDNSNSEESNTISCPDIFEDYNPYEFDFNNPPSDYPGECYSQIPNHNELVLWLGNDSSQVANNDKYDLLIIIENETLSDIDNLLTQIFTDNTYSLRNTKPFSDIDFEQYFNIYFYSLPNLQDYSTRTNCINAVGSKGVLDTSTIYNQNRFDSVANNYDFIDNKVYFTKDPQVWPHVELDMNTVNLIAPPSIITFGEAENMKMSTTCNSYYNNVLGFKDIYYLNDNQLFSSIFVHEFGHLFGLLGDEYDNANAMVKKNCATDINDAQSRWAPILGVTPSTNLNSLLEESCAIDSAYRYTNNSIMRNNLEIDYSIWSEGYKDLNIYYLNQRLDEINITY